MASTIYLDSSALVKRYVNETGSDWIRAMCNPGTSNDIVTALISKAECSAALTLNADLAIAQRAALTFITADGDLLQAARNEGLIVDNPIWHP